MKSYGVTIQLKQLKLYLFTFTINKLQIQTTCKIVELFEAGSMETCLLPIPLWHCFDVALLNLFYNILQNNVGNLLNLDFGHFRD